MELRYAYDSADRRVLKTAVDSSGAERHTLYPFASLEVRRAEWKSADGGITYDYDRTRDTEVPYLFAHGVRLARIAFEDSATPSIPTLSMPRLHVFIELSDHLGSTDIVVDKDTSELVERSTFQAYGATESDYRPDRWKAFREDHRFTGKEEDVEVGIVYFGMRYYAPSLGRWISADPLTIHHMGADPNPYAYVRGRVLGRTDSLGLEDDGGFFSTLGKYAKAYGKVTVGFAIPAVGVYMVASSAKEAYVKSNGNPVAVVHEVGKAVSPAYAQGASIVENAAGALDGASRLKKNIGVDEDKALGAYVDVFVGTVGFIGGVVSVVGLTRSAWKPPAGTKPTNPKPPAPSVEPQPTPSVPVEAPAPEPLTTRPTSPIKTQKIGTAGGERAYKKFTETVKKQAIAESATKPENNGVARCADCDVAVKPATKSVEGVTPDPAEARIDHIHPRSRGGNGDITNAEVRCFACNAKKSDKVIGTPLSPQAPANDNASQTR